MTKCPQAETRIDCQARMGLILEKELGTYVVSDLILEYNHAFYPSHALHLMTSHRKISEQALEIEMADDSGIKPKDAHELASRQVGGSCNLSYTCHHYNNYLRTKRQCGMAYGQAGSMMLYFRDKIVENPSFQYVLHMGYEDQIANIFWADAKMLVDYHTSVML